MALDKDTKDGLQQLIDRKDQNVTLDVGITKMTVVDVDKKLIEGVSEYLTKDPINMPADMAHTNAKEFLQMFDGRSDHAAQFLLDMDKDPRITAIMESATTPEQYAAATKELVQQHQNGTMNDYLVAQQPNITPPAQQPAPQAPPQPAAPITVMGEPVVVKAVEPKQDKTATAEPPVSEEVASLNMISDLLNDHLKTNPQDQALAENFLKGAASDPKLAEALKTFKANNGDMLKGGDGDDMMAGFMNKDAMISDLLASYKDTPDKAYAALSNPDFQTEAFMQYSSLGQAASMIAKPILDWIGGLFGQDSTLGGWAEMDFSSIMKDFQAFFNGGMNNAIGMSNNNMGLMDSLSSVFSVGMGAAEDALDMTAHDRQYMAHHNPDLPANTVTLVDGETNTIVREVTLGAAPQSAAELAAEEQKRQAAALQQQQQNGQNPNAPGMDAPGAGG